MQNLKFLVISFFIIFCTSCAVYPKKISYYDHKCDQIAKKYIIETDFKELGGNQCHDNSCIGIILIKLGLVSVEALVAGSIAVVGNTVY